MRGSSGFAAILVATAVAGLAGLVATVIVARQVGPVANAPFAIFFSTIYLFVSALSGLQQELTRATTEREFDRAAPASRARNFGVGAALVVVVVILASTPIWPARIFGEEPFLLVLPLAVGAGSYVLVATLAGTLFGVTRLGAVAALVAVDALSRLIALGIVSAMTDDTVALAWAVAAPFPLAVVLVWPFIRRSVVGRTSVDVGYRVLTRNVAGTIVAAASTGVLVSGFPLILGLTSVGESATTLGILIPAITIVRAPLIVAVTALQGVLIVRFRDHPDAARTTSARILAVLAAATGLLALVGWLIGAPVFTTIFGERYSGVVDGSLIAALIASSGLVAALSVTGSAALARSSHVVFTAGWVAAAVVTVIALALPLELEARILLALFSGPITGLLVHLAGGFAGRGSSASGGLASSTDSAGPDHDGIVRPR